GAREGRYGRPAVHLGVDGVAPVREGDERFVHLGVLASGRTSVDIAFWRTRGAGDDDALLCKGRVRTVGVDMDTLRPVPVPEHWRAAFAAWRIDATALPG